MPTLMRKVLPPWVAGPRRGDKDGPLVDLQFDHYQPGLIGFDVVFAETDESSGLEVLRELGRTTLRSHRQFQRALQQISPQLEYDRLFART